MPRTARYAAGGMIFHVWNRGVGRMRLLLKDADFYQVVRYVERNALRADLIERAEEWRWSSLWRRVYGTADDRRWLGKSPLSRPRNWVDLVNAPQTETEFEAIRRSVTWGQPYGQDNWIRKTAKRLGLESTLRSRGRPRKDAPNN